MELLNIEFAILVIKIAICVLPGVFGTILLVSSGEAKRGIRNALCNRLFGVSNAIPFAKFSRFLAVVGLLMVLFSFVASWFLLLREML